MQSNVIQRLPDDLHLLLLVIAGLLGASFGSSRRRITRMPSAASKDLYGLREASVSGTRFKL